MPMYPFSTPWKLEKTVRFSDVFRGKRKGALGTNTLIKNETKIYYMDTLQWKNWGQDFNYIIL